MPASNGLTSQRLTGRHPAPQHKSEIRLLLKGYFGSLFCLRRRKMTGIEDLTRGRVQERVCCRQKNARNDETGQKSLMVNKIYI
ncbi:hypothetical protein EG713_01365 [Salmonella enterica]|nr:hypothetical protein [Salmonella enterica]EBX5079877.1 hypothetical protein [Salmonella enterica subsp. enterica serovar Oranienburg]EAS7973755.1 hypothetical protein [Salmonella enterica]EBK4918614.1 hypothetical protein [Salmonella enterica]EBM0032045.1 hypothetical protein [Salmonella enterica]